MRATPGRAGTGGAWCGSGWSDVEGQPGAAPVFELAAGIRRPSFDSAAAVGAAQAAPFYHHSHVADAPLGNAAIQTSTAVGPDAPLDLVTNLPVLLHVTNLVTEWRFVPDDPHLD